MTKLLSILIKPTILMLGIACSGCASSGYWNARLNDAADIMTFSIGTGVGGKVRAGPVHCGLLLNSDQFGLRSGSLSKEWAHLNFDYTTGFIPAFGIERGFSWDSFNPGERGVMRGKDVNLASPRIPFVYLVKPDDEPWPWPETLFHYGQVEAVIGVGLTIRVGINIVEAVDFLLGFIGIDILQDDVLDGNRSRKNNSGQNNVPANDSDRPKRRNVLR